ncbi:MAG: preprotein translocase subunit SecE [Solirubrobacteraceae bacterium]
MARNRKRRNEGRPSRPVDGVLAEPGVRTASAAGGGGRAASRGGGGGSPAPLEHAAPEAEIVEAQLALGRAADAIAPGASPEPDDDDAYEDADLDDLADDDDALDGGAGGGRGAGGGGWRGGGEGSGGGSRPGAQGGGAVVPSPSSVPGSRVVHFLQGSWRELQRVQWPDRPQVMQATGVVIGFVIIAGLFLGLSDFVSQRLVNFILR